jgi:hypothetical protein
MTRIHGMHTLGICLSIILPVVLYGCETWSRDIYRRTQTVRASENMVLRRIFGLNRDEIIGGWRKLCNEDLHSL